MEAVKDGQLKLSDSIQASRLASKMGGSQVYLKEGESFSVEEMLAALLIGSADDAAAALAERLGGTVEGAVKLMNERAAALKLTKTRFGSVHGLPPGAGQEGDITTPRDMARLGQELVKFPDVLRWTRTPEAPIRGGVFTLRNSNQLIGHFAGADGIKTGHFHQAGYSVAATAKRGNLRLIAVVMGAPTNRARFSEAARLLGEGFTRYVEVSVVKASIHRIPLLFCQATAGTQPHSGLQGGGGSLEEIARILRENPTPDELRGMLKAQLARAEPEMQAARERRELIPTRLNTLTLEENMPVYELTLKPVEELTIAAIREAVQVIEQMPQRGGQMFDTIGLWLKANNLSASAAMTIYYNEGFARENIDTECAFILPDTTSWKAARQDEVVTVRQLAAVPQMASTIVTDDFYRKVDGLSPAYTSLACWIENNGCRIVGPPRELFYGSVQNGDLTAEVQFPVEKA